jgi:hypothetical protein
MAPSDNGTFQVFPETGPATGFVASGDAQPAQKIKKPETTPMPTVRIFAGLMINDRKDQDPPPGEKNRLSAGRLFPACAISKSPETACNRNPLTGLNLS